MYSFSLNGATPGMDSQGPPVQFGSQEHHFEDALPVSHTERRDGPESMQSWLQTDAPWAPTSAFGDGTTSHYLRTAPAFQTYRNTFNPSDCGETQPDDSGYGKSIETTSIRGDDTYPSTQNQLGFENDLNRMHIMMPDMYSQPVDSQFSTSTVLPHDDALLTCHCCDKTFKNKSEMKKHNARKERPFTCDREGCPKRQHGFASNNDLVRHRRTVHGEPLKGPKYICTNGECAKEAKEWLRTDNFRSHLKRVHKIELNGDADLQRYLYVPIPDDLQGVGTKLHEPSSMHSESLFAVPPAHAKQIAEFASTNPFSPSAEVSLYTPEPVLEGMMPYSGRGFSLEAIPQDDGPFESHLDPISLDSHPSAESLARSLTPAASVMSLGAQDEPSDSQVEPKSAPQSQSSMSSVSSGSIAEVEQPITVDDDDEESETELTGAASSRGDDLEQQFRCLPHDKQVAFLASLPAALLQKALRSKEEVPETDAVSQSSTTTKGKAECPTCKKTFTRPCELRKHSKRHEKPYGCTVHECEKTFGSKNDWKRHECQQHSPLEIWQCVKDCGQVFGTRDQLSQHLETAHDMSRLLMDERLEDGRRSIQSMAGFWCGFCRDTVPFTHSTADRSTFRFDHIDDHFMGRHDQPKRKISDWVHVEKAPTARRPTAAAAKRASSKEGNSRKRKPSPSVEVRPSKQVYTGP